MGGLFGGGGAKAQSAPKAAAPVKDPYETAKAAGDITTATNLKPATGTAELIGGELRLGKGDIDQIKSRQNLGGRSSVNSISNNMTGTKMLLGG